MNTCKYNQCKEESTEEVILYGKSITLCNKHAHGAKLGNWENIDTTDESIDCEKCGGETGVKLIGDESYNYCSDCKWGTWE